MFLTWRKYRSDNLAVSTVTTPRQAAALPHRGHIPFDDISNNSQSYYGVLHIPAPADPWDRSIPTPAENRQQIIPDASTTDAGSAPTSMEYTRDPLAGFTFGNSWMAPNIRVTKAKSMNRSLHTQPSIHQNSAEGSGQLSDTQQIGWSEQSSLRMMDLSGRSSMSTEYRAIRRFTMGE
jgi:hypothetical protein